jgi:hypothetical protein
MAFLNGKFVALHNKSLTEIGNILAESSDKNGVGIELKLSRLEEFHISPSGVRTISFQLVGALADAIERREGVRPRGPVATYESGVFITTPSPHPRWG